MSLHENVDRIMISQEQIAQRVKELAVQLDQVYQGRKPLMVCILKGSVVFFADLIREMDTSMEIDFMSVSSYGAGTTFAKMDDVLPPFITKAMRFALTDMDKRLRGFANPDALLTAPETRTSSPIRIERDEKLQSISHRGIYPCGEGAGYAGGITSSAVDGIKVADAIFKNFA